MTRRRLFPETAPKYRRSLFSNTAEESLKSVKCSDCGFTYSTTAHPHRLVCPKCGGQRFNLVTIPVSPENIPERVSVFEEERDNKLDAALKTFSGREVATGSVEKLFGVSADELCQRGYSENLGSTVKINESAYLQSKLFSKISITITKELDLDPSICCSGSRAAKDRALDFISGSPSLSPKSIMIIRRTHGLPVSPEEGEAEWLKDSGIIHDLPNEFGDRVFSLPEFKRILSNRYDDAPDGIMSLLEMNRTISREPGGMIKVLG